MSSTDPGRVARAAAILAEARRSGQPIEGLPADAQPASEDEAWEIQREVMRLLGLSVGGWKCATPPGKSPSGAAMPAAGFLPSPATMKFPWGQRLGIEAEIAVRLGADLPARPGRPYTREDIVAAIDAVMPALELVHSRYTDMRAVSPLEAMADGIAHFGFVHGAPAPGWRELDLSRLHVRLAFDDETQVEQTGGNPAGDPLAPVVWLANRLPETGTQLRAGEIVTTGSCTGLIFIDPGTPEPRRITAAFEGLGKVALELAAACPFGFG
jgi:2-keto-4-pentenoate hydratase